ncbi:ATP-binding protein [Chloroflexota bacterium]
MSPKDTSKTKDQLISELVKLRGRVSQLEVLETERKLAEDALRESEERFRGVAERNFDMIYELDLEGRITYLSSAGEMLAGGKPEEILGTFFHDHLPESEKPKGIDALTTVSKGQSMHSYQLDIIRNDGSVVSFEFNSSPILKDGGVVGVYGVARDITERKRAEEKEREVETLKEIDRLRTDLLANVSHELRTPLATIKGYATMLLNYDAKLAFDAKQDHLNSIDNAADQLMELIDGLLDISQLEAGLFKLRKTPTGISDLITDAVIESQARAPQHQMILEIPKKLPKVDIDSRRIRQVLDNLIDNACKYSKPQTDVIIRAKRVNQELVISVTDHGTGIPKQYRERVFDRMYRVEQEQSSNQASGMGLGLSICKGLVEAHNGRIWIESKVDKGTTCLFTLPLDTRQIQS